MTRERAVTRNRYPVNPTTPPLLLAAFLLAAACGPAAETPDSSTATIPRLEPIATFGCAECDGPEMLARPSVEVGASGRTYILDSEAPMVRVLDADGNLGLTMGRKGEGPGEFRLPLLIGVVEDGSGGFWAQEISFLHHFDADGVAVESHPYDGRLPVGVAVDHERQRIYMIGAPLPIPGATRGDRALLRYDPGSEEAHEVVPWEFVAMEREEDAPAKAGWRTLAVATDGDIAVVDVVNYRVRRFSPDGELVDEFGRPGLEHPRKSPERLERERRAFPGREPDPELPHVGERAGYDGDGRLWLHALRGPGILDVFSPEGEFLGEVDTGEGISRSWPALSVQGDRLAIVTTDEMDLPRVKLYRIVAAR